MQGILSGSAVRGETKAMSQLKDKSHMGCGSKLVFQTLRMTLLPPHTSKDCTGRGTEQVRACSVKSTSNQGFFSSEVTTRLGFMLSGNCKK